MMNSLCSLKLQYVLVIKKKGNWFCLYYFMYVSMKVRLISNIYLFFCIIISELISFLVQLLLWFMPSFKFVVGTWMNLDVYLMAYFSVIISQNVSFLLRKLRTIFFCLFFFLLDLTEKYLYSSYLASLSCGEFIPFSVFYVLMPLVTPFR